MTEPTFSLERLVRPTWLLAGVACGFVACCLAGHWAGQTVTPRAFTRFHIYLTPSALYYPTASQIRNLGIARLDPDKIVVIVGGSSKLQGSGMPADDLWSDHLQELLGEGYQVLNLAVSGGQVNDCGAVAAELLEAGFPRLILVADAGPGGTAGDPDGGLYRFLFWDAYAKGMLPVEPDREAALAATQAHRAGDRAFAELKAQMRLDSLLRFQDLWNGIAYEHLFTVWTRPAAQAPWRARRKFRDPERTSLAVAARYPEETREEYTEFVRRIVNGCRPDGQGGWEIDADSPVWATLEENARTAFPARARPRTLLLTVRHSPFYVNRLDPDEQAHYDALCRYSTSAMAACGYEAAEVGREFGPEDYVDLGHFSGEGGRKLAAEVAPLVKALAARLGYARQAE